ncbi:MAG: hypothetical protein GXO46_14645 [Chlorobi bacterium]|nr:hypothetical protein [Chlorobiota bacterium]
MLKQVEVVIDLDYKKIILVVFIFFFSCSDTMKSSVITEEEFITVPGIYYFNGNTLKLSNIDNGCYTFSLKKRKENIIYIDGNINECFNKNSFWSIFIDEKKNVWFFNSDYGNSSVWLSQENYKQHNFIKEKMILPEKFSEKIKIHK